MKNKYLTNIHSDESVKSGNEHDFALSFDISELMDSVYKSFLYIIVPVFNYYTINKKNLQNINLIMQECIFEWNKIIKMLEGELSLLSKVRCLKDERGIYWVKDSFGLYNLGMALVQFKKMDDDIELISLGETLSDKKENLQLLVNIRETVTFWNYGLTSVLWENYRYKYSSKYGMAILNNAYLQDVLRIFILKYHIFSDELIVKKMNRKELDVIDMFYLYSKHEIDIKCNSIRMQYAELAYMYSPFVMETRKNDIGILFDVLWKIFCDCEIAKVYIEEYERKTEKDINDIGSKDRTTRVHFIFSLKNNDIYSLRIDMPHKGVEYIHINLQELQNGYVIESAMPILCKDKLQKVKEILKDDIKKFFYETGEDLWWFRINFLNIIKEINDKEKEKKLRVLFEEQKHFKLNISSDGYDLFNEFKYYIKIFLSKFVQTNTPINIAKEIAIYRCVLWSREMLELIRPAIDNEEEIDCIIDRYINVIKKEASSYIEGFSEKEWDELSYKDVLELLLEYFWNI